VGDDAGHQRQQKKKKQRAPTPERKAALAKDVSELLHVTATSAARAPRRLPGSLRTS
jgi:phenylpyruvate tautomerase PptA (4-oxalocrotonate tautomerase family)